MEVPLLIFGAGGDGKAVLDSALMNGLIAALVADGTPKRDELFGVPVVASFDLTPVHFVVAVGHNAARARFSAVIQDATKHNGFAYFPSRFLIAGKSDILLTQQ